MFTAQKFYIQLFVAVLILAGLAYLAWFAFNLIISESANIQNTKTEIASLNLQKTKVSEISKKYETAAPLLPVIESTLLSDNDQDKLSFVLLIEDLAQQTNVEQEIDYVGSFNEKGSLPFASFNIGVTGSFSNVLKFLYLLENSQHYLNINTVQINKNKEYIKAQMMVKIYQK